MRGFTCVDLPLVPPVRILESLRRLWGVRGEGSRVGVNDSGVTSSGGCSGIGLRREFGEFSGRVVESQLKVEYRVGTLGYTCRVWFFGTSPRNSVWGWIFVRVSFWEPGWVFSGVGTGSD